LPLAADRLCWLRCRVMFLVRLLLLLLVVLFVKFAEALGRYRSKETLPPPPIIIIIIIIIAKHNRKAPGPDGIHKFWIKRFTTTHSYLHITSVNLQRTRKKYQTF
jgi:hypothetical protein